MATPEDDAAARAARAAAGAPLMNFVDFTTGLIHGVFQTLVDATTEQMRAYVDLVGAVSGTLKDYQDKTLGDADTAAVKYLNEFVVPEFVLNPPATPLTATEWQATATPALTINRDKVPSLLKIYDGVLVDQKALPEPLHGEDVTTGDVTIATADIYKYTKTLLLRGVSRSFDELRVLLQMGLMKVVPDKGFIETALMFDVKTTDTSDQSTTQTDVQTASRYRAFNVNASSSYSSTKNTRSFFGLKAMASSLTASISGGYASGSSSSEYRVRVVNDKSSSVTNVETNITGRVRIDFKTDYFPLMPPPPAPPPALPPANG
jgi:hypothetical protein